MSKAVCTIILLTNKRLKVIDLIGSPDLFASANISHISKPKHVRNVTEIIVSLLWKREKRQKAKMLFEHELVSFAHREEEYQWRSRCCRFLFGNRFHLIELQAFNLISCRLLKCFRIIKSHDRISFWFFLSHRRCTLRSRAKKLKWSEMFI